jgi:hypothetical protein
MVSRWRSMDSVKQPSLLDGFLAGAGLDLTPFWTPPTIKDL